MKELILQDLSKLNIPKNTFYSNCYIVAASKRGLVDFRINSENFDSWFIKTPISTQAQLHADVEKDEILNQAYQMTINQRLLSQEEFKFYNFKNQSEFFKKSSDFFDWQKDFHINESQKNQEISNRNLYLTGLGVGVSIISTFGLVEYLKNKNNHEVITTITKKETKILGKTVSETITTETKIKK